mgnify:CR=1 FL=1
MLLAMKMERELGKDEIFELYLNKSFFGHRAYGVGAAAEFYYGKTLDALTLDEAGGIHVRVTAAPEDGRANAAVRKLLARALGIAPSRLTLVGGATARDKLFRVD